MSRLPTPDPARAALEPAANGAANDWASDRVPPKLPHSKKEWTAVSRLPLRLRQLANGCEEQAYRANDRDAQVILAIVARKARSAASSPHLSIEGRQTWLTSLSDLSSLALWLDSAGIAGPVSPVVRSSDAAPRICRDFRSSPADSLSEDAIGADVLKVSELAARFGISERGARKAIERAASQNRAGFYRIGGLWFADPQAFAGVIRKGSMAKAA